LRQFDERIVDVIVQPAFIEFVFCHSRKIELSIRIYTVNERFMLKLNSAHRSALRSEAHALDPVVLIGEAGLTEAVLKEINLALDSHGLIKIRVFGDDREARIAIYNTICEQMDAAPIQHIGKLLVVYRQKKEPVRPYERDEKRGKGPREMTVMKSGGNGSIRNRVSKVVVKGNERVTHGGLVKRKDPRQTSAKKAASNKG
jgi:putative YhbY family RNA-binding protein